jgi:signal transduction histidine kinase
MTAPEIKHPKGTLWLSASPARAVAETLLIAAGLSLLGLTLSFLDGRGLGLVSNPSLVLLDGPFCAIWCAIRLRWYGRSWWRWLLHDGAVGALLGLLPTLLVVLTLATFLVRVRGTRAAFILDQHLGRFSIPVFVVIALVAFTAEFVVFRLGVRIWLFWDRLRRTHLVWALTHAHLLVVLLAAGLLGIPLLGADIYYARGNPLLLVPLLFFLFTFTLIAMLIVLPPSALFSYLFARRTTARLRSLAAATDALRAGDYAARIPVNGEDEVAQLQANFNAMAAELERAVRDLQAERDTVATLLRNRRELVASVSHELRTPIATLRGYLESSRAHWDEDAVPPPSLQRDLEVMERETIHLHALVDDLFALSRAEVGRLELHAAPTDALAAARRVTEAMAPLAWRSSRVALVADGPDGLPFALVDPARLEQVLRNLLHNAVRHTGPGGIVAVRAEAEAEAVVLRVKDTGEGIAAEELPHIFERFYRGENRRARSSGAGLGLALAKELTEAMGGSIGAESVPGEGSCFMLRLPLAPEGAGALLDRGTSEGIDGARPVESKQAEPAPIGDGVSQ